MDDKMIIGQRLQYYRKQAKMTRQEIAEYCGVSKLCKVSLDSDGRLEIEGTGSMEDYRSDMYVKSKPTPNNTKPSSSISNETSDEAKTESSKKDTHRDQTTITTTKDVKGKIGIAVKRLIQLTKSIVLVAEMPLQASISASSNKWF